MGRGGTGGAGITLVFIVLGEGLEGVAITLVLMEGGGGELGGGNLLCEIVLRLIVVLGPLGSNFLIRSETLEF